MSGENDEDARRELKAVRTVFGSAGVSCLAYSFAKGVETTWAWVFVGVLFVGVYAVTSPLFAEVMDGLTAILRFIFGIAAALAGLALLFTALAGIVHFMIPTAVVAFLGAMLCFGLAAASLGPDT